MSWCIQSYFERVSGAFMQRPGECYIAQIRALERDAEIGWKQFVDLLAASIELNDEEQIQPITLIATLHSFCYGSERLNEALFFTGADSAPNRFYINSLYHFISARRR